eukprot:753057-Hanusia_phi.AAC.1
MLRAHEQEQSSTSHGRRNPLLRMRRHVVHAAHEAHAGVGHHHHLVAVAVAGVALGHGLELLDVGDDVLAVGEPADASGARRSRRSPLTSSRRADALGWLR